jgi:hypothetical protein
MPSPGNTAIRKCVVTSSLARTCRAAGPEPRWANGGCCDHAASRRAKNRAIKVALAGTGYFSQFHLDGWSRVPEAQLVALCSLDPAELAAAAARYLIPRQFADVGAMLDAVAPDLLDIVTPPAAHLDPARGRRARRRRHLPEAARRRSGDRTGDGPDREGRRHHLRRARELPFSAVVSGGETADRGGRARRDP